MSRRFKIADGFVQNTGAKPAGCLPVGKNQIRRRDSNSNLIKLRVVHKKFADRSARVANGDCRIVGGKSI